MKKAILAVLACVFGLFSLLSQTVMAAEKKGFYAGVGMSFLSSGSLPSSAQEEGLHQNWWFNGHAHTMDTQRTGKNIILGYQITDTFAVEAGYIGGDSGATSSTSGSSPLGAGGDFVHISNTQKETMSARHLSVVAQKPLNEFFKVMGRIGMISVHKEHEERLMYVWPASWGNDGSYQGWSSASDDSAALFGVGVSAKVLENLEVRAEVLKSSALPEVVPKVDVVFSF